MTRAKSKLLELANQLDDLCKKRATGELIIKNADGEGKILLLSGRLLFATDGLHSVRRWHRAIKQYCPQWKTPSIENKENNNLPWEYQLLYQGIKEKQLQVDEAKKVIRAIAKEVFFNIACSVNSEFFWQDTTMVKTQVSLSLSLSYVEVEPSLINTAKMHREWCLAGLSKLNPTLAPVLKKNTTEQALQGMETYLKGQLSLWDLALGMKKTVHQVTCALVPLIKKRVLQFRIIPDLPLPLENKNPPSIVQKLGINIPLIINPTPKGLIACVDDSPIIFEVLRKIVEPEGYKLLCIQEPMRGFGQLIEKKPDLIFLDLIMPTANGYSVCKFLRKTSIFEKTPIVILTSRDTLIDRNRARLVGASDFLGKPPQKDKTLEIIRKYLTSEKNKQPTNSNSDIINKVNLAF
jgi:two-component system, chemotaxis family, response regulator PixG